MHSNLSARYLLVPPQLVGKARRAVRNMVLGDSQDIIVHQESRLSAFGIVDPKTDNVILGSATNWLLAATASSRPSVVVGGLGGNLRPIIRTTKLDKGQWGTAFDIILDIGAAIVDYRGLYFATGAT